MPQVNETYTYRNGQKVLLNKSADEFVVRATPEALSNFGIIGAERVSPASSRVQTRRADLEAEMSRARAIAPTHHAYYTADTGEEFLITDRLLITFRTALTAEEVAAFAGKYGLIVKQHYGERDYLFQLTEHTGINPVKLIVKLTEEEPQVEMAEHDLNYRMKRYQLQLPTDPAYARQWHLHTTFNHAEFNARASARCESAWQLLDSFGNSSVVIGITDDGCRLDHPDFDSANKFAQWGYFRGERLITRDEIDAVPAQMYLAGADHGTSCAGVIGGEADAVLTVGAAPACQLLPIQWESEGPSLLITDSKMLTALTFIGDKVDVLSNSWGSVPRNNWPMQVVNRIKQLALTGGRRGRGIVFLWAAGNENCPISHTSTQLIPHDHGWRRNQNGTFTWVGPPRARVFENNLVGIPGVMHVAALASTAQRSHYSNYGTGIGVCAPSSNSHAYFRIVPFSGLGITTTSGETGFVTEEFGGTSSATPLVAGIVGLVLSANPDLSALEVISILKQTASKDLSMQGYPRTPPASFDPTPTWDISPVAPFDSGAFQNIGSPDGTWSPWFGHGKVNAEAAVAEAIRRRGGGGTTTTATVIRHASTPALVIPDNNAAGVSNTINVPESARIGAIKIAVDIAHPFIGDLLVTLGAPSGSQVVLHNRNGGNADNIQRTFDLVSTPGLSALLGQAVQGNWTLTVQDQAPSDTGTLNRWELEITTSAGAESEASESPGTNIPDNNPAGIERSLTINDNGSIKELAVAVDITHTFIGDLRVSLVAPSGTSINLHNRSGGGTDNLITTFDTANTTALQVLRGQAAQGAWKLRVADLAGQDIGKLNRWALRITRQA